MAYATFYWYELNQKFKLLFFLVFIKFNFRLLKKLDNLNKLVYTLKKSMV